MAYRPELTKSQKEQLAIAKKIVSMDNYLGVITKQQMAKARRIIKKYG